MKENDKKSKIPKEFSDENLINSIKNTHFLGEETKKIYLRRLDVVQKKIWNNCDNDGFNLYCIIKHSTDFFQKLSKVDGKVGYLIAMMALFRYNQFLKEKEYTLYNEWNEELEHYKEEQRNTYRKNEPTDKQKKGFITFDEICTIRDTLPPLYQGTQEHILIQLFTEMPPLRANDFYSAKIYHVKENFDADNSPIHKITAKNKKIKVSHKKKLTKKNSKDSKSENVKKDDTKSDDDDKKGNYVEVFSDKILFVLQDYKTKHTYKKKVIELPPKVSSNIRNLLKKNPNRPFLFMSTKNKPFASRKAFNIWANKALRTILKNEHFSLTMFRHIYISRPDLDLRSKSGIEQQEIADKMCHSISSQQQSYHWITPCK